MKEHNLKHRRYRIEETTLQYVRFAVFTEVAPCKSRVNRRFHALIMN
jgi:hypothetical protein